MTARLYGLWILSVILALVLEFLTPGMLRSKPTTSAHRLGVQAEGGHHF